MSSRIAYSMRIDVHRLILLLALLIFFVGAAAAAECPEIDDAISAGEWSRAEAHVRSVRARSERVRCSYRLGLALEAAGLTRYAASWMKITLQYAHRTLDGDLYTDIEQAKTLLDNAAPGQRPLSERRQAQVLEPTPAPEPVPGKVAVADEWILSPRIDPPPQPPAPEVKPLPVSSTPSQPTQETEQKTAVTEPLPPRLPTQVTKPQGPTPLAQQPAAPKPGGTTTVATIGQGSSREPSTPLTNTDIEPVQPPKIGDEATKPNSTRATDTGSMGQAAPIAPRPGQKPSITEPIVPSPIVAPAAVDSCADITARIGGPPLSNDPSMLLRRYAGVSKAQLTRCYQTDPDLEQAVHALADQYFSAVTALAMEHLANADLEAGKTLIQQVLYQRALLGAARTRYLYTKYRLFEKLLTGERDLELLEHLLDGSDSDIQAFYGERELIKKLPKS